MKLKIIISLSLLLVISAFVNAQDGYKIIVNKQNEIKTLTLEDLYKIFTGKKTTWENGSKIKLIIQKNGEYHQEFILDVTKMKSVKFAQLWKKKIFTGRASNLRIAENDQEILQWIESNPDAIGYIANKSFQDSVKKIRIETD